MRTRRISLIVGFAAALGLLGTISATEVRADTKASAASPKTKGTTKTKSNTAATTRARDAKNDKSQKQRTARTTRSKRSRGKQTGRHKLCKRKNGKRRCRWVSRFSGRSVPKSKLRTEPLPKPSGELWIYAVNFREEVKVNLYDADGNIDEAALAQLDRTFRCRRTGEERAVDPRLYELLSILYDQFGKRRIELVSGFRNQPNQGSRHFHASAMDIRIAGVSARKLYDAATRLDGGNMGIGLYPTSRFVHIDFRAPGEKSYRWTDYSGSSKGQKPRRTRKRKPNS